MIFPYWLSSYIYKLHTYLETAYTEDSFVSLLHETTPSLPFDGEEAAETDGANPGGMFVMQPVSVMLSVLESAVMRCDA